MSCRSSTHPANPQIYQIWRKQPIINIIDTDYRQWTGEKKIYSRVHIVQSNELLREIRGMNSLQQFVVKYLPDFSLILIRHFLYVLWRYFCARSFLQENDFPNSTMTIHTDVQTKIHREWDSRQGWFFGAREIERCQTSTWTYYTFGAMVFFL